MGRPLTAAQIAKITKPGKYYDQYGLYLNVKPSGAASWVLRYTFAGRTRYLGLGPLQLVNLTEARRKTLVVRKQIMDGQDPLAKTEPTSCPTFRTAAEAYIKVRSSGWKGDKGPGQWKQNLASYAYPVLGDMPVSEISQSHVIAILEPLWSTKTTTASRLRQRIENILDAAKAQGHRSGDNPARWKGHLETIFPAKTRVHKVRHHPSMPYQDVPAFFSELSELDCTSSRALQFLILNANRTSEAIAISTAELDKERNCWIIPATRMKSDKQHRVPLSLQAKEIVKKQVAALPKDHRHLFPTSGKDEPLSNAAMYVLLKRHGGAQYTVHGFRRSFRNWAAETISHSREIAELALAHSVAKGAEAAYWTSDLYDRRLELMQSWADHCSGQRK